MHVQIGLQDRAGITYVYASSSNSQRIIRPSWERPNKFAQRLQD